MLADTAEQYFGLILDPNSSIVKSKDDLLSALSRFDAPDDIKAKFAETAKFGSNGGVVHVEYKDMRESLGEADFFRLLEQFGMSRTLFGIFDDSTCSQHPTGEWGYCYNNKYTICVAGTFGCA